jgi:hypothetical protein
MERGILVGCDLLQEWLLPWWWDGYCAQSSAPVAFADFGMSKEARGWCEARGVVFSCGKTFAASDKERIDPRLREDWERGRGELWESRSAWFKKPLACQRSPFQRSVWIDLDCEIKAPLEDLFSYCEHPSGMSLCKQLHTPTIYNSGVICFRRGCSLIDRWAATAEQFNHLFSGDQELLSCLIFAGKEPVGELPKRYNCSRLDDLAGASIIHWHGAHGKQAIRLKIAQNTLGDYLTCARSRHRDK